ncbi:MAG TPA: hypothetical protein VEK08_08990 [Planctomycetota bacterium]|nr:hypothetical protein [Planctomycetota bacterium]
MEHVSRFAKLFMLTLLASSLPVWAQSQGLIITPMRVEAAARPGQAADRIIKLKNTADESKIFDLTLVNLVQARDGGWIVVEPGNSEVELSEYSCLEWTTLSAKTVTVDAMQMSPVTVTVRPPARARGFYFAGILVQARTPAQQKGVSVAVRFLIPILLDVQGRPERQQIRLAEAGLVYREETPKKRAATFATLNVRNEGRTYSRIKGQIKVQHLSNKTWKHVLTVWTKDIGLVPGANVELPVDVNRRLPSGHFKISAALSVDGRMLSPVEREISFSGDPSATKVAVDTALTLNPSEICIAGIPGATRTTLLSVENSADHPVSIETRAFLPPPMRGMSMGDLTGESLSCAGWIQVLPERFTLGARAKQNVRIIASMPKTETTHAAYYGTVSLQASYLDGQSAGQTTSLVSVRNKHAEVKPSALAVRMSIAATESGGYAVQARFSNAGNIHVLPSARVTVTSLTGRTEIKTALEGDQGQMLPLESRDFSRLMDFEKVPPGSYILKAELGTATEVLASQSLPIVVSVADGKCIVNVITDEEDKDIKASVTSLGAR